MGGIKKGRSVSRRSIVTAAGAALATPALAQTNKPGVRYVQPPTMAPAPTYTHVVEITGPGRLIYTSGERGSDKDGKMAPDIRSQSIQAFENIKAALAAVGATFDNVVKLNVYMLDLRAHHRIFSEIKQQYINMKSPPASTTVQVPLLTRDGVLVEVEAVAALPAI